MATDTNSQTPRRDSVMGSINSPGGTAEVVRSFRNALKALSSNQGFQNLAELVDEVPKLEANLLEKDRALKLALESSEREKEAHKNERQSNLQLYSDEHKRLETEKTHVEQGITKLQASIAEKDQIIAEKIAKESSLKEGGRKLEDICRSMQAKLKARDEEIAQLKHQSQGNCKKADGLAVELKKTRGEVSSVQGSLQKIQQRNEQLEAALDNAQDREEEISSYSVRLQDIDASQLAQDLNAVWVSVTALVRKFVGDDLNETTLKRDWTVLNLAAGYVPIKELPQSNSDIAKEMRVLKVLAILANTIHKHLLQPTCLPAGENRALGEALYELASIAPKRERMLRGMLLAALEPRQEQAELQLLSWILGDVLQRQGVGLIIRPDLLNGFESSLDDILSDVQDIWLKAQVSTQVFEARFEATHVTEFDWQVQTSQASEQLKTQPNENDDDLFILFPTVYLVTNEKVPITTGTATRKSRISALLKEERHNTRSAEPAPSKPRQRPRMLSMSSSARNGTKEDFLPRSVGPADGNSKV